MKIGGRSAIFFRAKPLLNLQREREKKASRTVNCCSGEKPSLPVSPKSSYSSLSPFSQRIKSEQFRRLSEPLPIRSCVSEIRAAIPKHFDPVESSELRELREILQQRGSTPCAPSIQPIFASRVSTPAARDSQDGR